MEFNQLAKNYLKMRNKKGFWFQWLLEIFVFNQF